MPQETALLHIAYKRLIFDQNRLDIFFRTWYINQAAGKWRLLLKSFPAELLTRFSDFAIIFLAVGD